MLMDVELFETLERANRLEKEAVFLMAYHYLTGEKVAKDIVKAREYLQLLAEDEEKDYRDFEYGKIYWSLANIYYAERNYPGANYYYKKSKEYIIDTYVEDYADELIKKYILEALIAETNFSY